MNKKIAQRTLLAALALGATVAAHAQNSPWSARIGVTQISPHVTSGDLSPTSLPGTKVDIDSATQLSGGITYRVNDSVSIDLPLALPFKHEIVGAGAIGGVGKIGEVKALPITVLAQWRFMPANAQVRPYVGIGPTYANFFKEQGSAVLTAITGATPSNPTTLSVKDKLGVTIQAGASFQVNPRWFIDANVTKTFLKTRATLSTGQGIDTKLDPTSISLAVGYRF